MATTSFMRAGFNLDVAFQRGAMIQLLQGIGVALFFMPVLPILLSDLEPHEMAAGTRLATFVRTLGGSFAAPLTTWALNQRTTIHHARLPEHLPASDEGVRQLAIQLGQGDLTRGALMLNQEIGQQAAQIGFNEIFHLLGIIFLAVIVLVWFARPPFTATGPRPVGGDH